MALFSSGKSRSSTSVSTVNADDNRIFEENQGLISDVRASAGDISTGKAEVVNIDLSTTDQGAVASALQNSSELIDTFAGYSSAFFDNVSDLTQGTFNQNSKNVDVLADSLGHSFASATDAIQENARRSTDIISRNASDTNKLVAQSVRSESANFSDNIFKVIFVAIGAFVLMGIFKGARK